MLKNNLLNLFKEYCKENGFEQNSRQIEIINQLNKFINPKKNILNYLINKKNKLCFYLQGDVGVGKTMLLNFVYNNFTENKLRLHFNEFMIKFHDFRHEYEKKGKNNSIEIFVKELKAKSTLLYLDEFQVTNIVDAMILGKLFEIVFKEGINVIVSSNTQIKDLYKDGLQREQFLPFIHLIKKFSVKSSR